MLSGGEGSIITRNINRRRLLLAVPTVDQRLLGTGFHLFLSLDSLRRSVSDAPTSRHHRQSSSEDIISQPLPYTSNNNGDNAMASVYHQWSITNGHILLAALQQLLTFCSLQTPISILARNNSYTLHRQPPQLHSEPAHNLSLVSAAGSAFNPNFLSDNYRSYLVWVISVELHRVRGLIAERNCGVRWVLAVFRRMSMETRSTMLLRS